MLDRNGLEISVRDTVRTVTDGLMGSVLMVGDRCHIAPHSRGVTRGRAIECDPGDVELVKRYCPPS